MPLLTAGKSLHDASLSDITNNLVVLLAANRSRVIDLFKAWDTDSDGLISKPEFRRAMDALGLDAADDDIDAIFEHLDADGNGNISFRELHRELSAATQSSSASVMLLLLSKSDRPCLRDCEINLKMQKVTIKNAKS